MSRSRLINGENHSISIGPRKRRVDAVALARGLFEARRYDEAGGVIGAAIRQAPIRSELHGLLATVERVAGRLSGSLRWSRRGAVLSPEELAGYANAALALFDLDNPLSAHIEAVRALHIDPAEARVWRLLAMCNDRRETRNAQFQTFRRCLILKPGEAGALADAAGALVRAGDTPGGTRLLRQSELSQPGRLRTLLALSSAYMRVSNYRRAMPVNRRAMLLRPNAAGVNADLAVIHLTQGRFAEGERYVRHALCIGPNRARLWGTLGSLHRHQGRLTGSVRAFTIGVLLDPGEVGNLVNLGIGYREKALAVDAARVFGWAAQIDPRHPVPQVGLALQAYLLGDFTGMLTSLNRMDLDRVSGKNRAFAQGYDSLLRQLSVREKPYQGTVPDDPNDVIYLVGDSHCLAPAYERISLFGRERVAVPVVVVGAKAWHLAQQGGDPQKLAFCNALDGVPRGSAVVFMVGEIDTRPDDGIIPYCRNHDEFISSVISTTVEGYLDFVEAESLARGLMPFVHGVAAPVRHSGRVCDDDAGLWVDVVREFNEELRSSTAIRRIAFLDVYRASAGPGGFADGSISLDGTHLEPHVLGFLTQSLKSTDGSAKPYNDERVCEP